jgi:GAF domain-containing protein
MDNAPRQSSDILKKLDATKRHPPDRNKILERAVDLIATFLNAERVLISLRSTETGKLEARAGHGLDLANVFLSGDVSLSITTEVLEKGSPIVSFDASDDRRYGDKTSVVLSGLRSVLCVPLKTHARVWGYIYVDNRKESGVFFDKHLKSLSQFADWLITVIV